MKELLKKRYAIYIDLLDNAYEQDLVNQHGSNFKYIFEVPTNYFIYPNYESNHKQKCLTKSYASKKEEDYIDMILAPLGYSNLMESTSVVYGWENGNDPTFTKEEIVEILNSSRFIQATTDCLFISKEDEIKAGKNKQEDYKNIYAWTDQSVLESLEDEICAFSTEVAL